MKRLIPLAALLLCLSAPSFAQPAPPVPPFLNYQGRLAKPDGTPVPDTNAQSLTFSLYDAATGGTLLWTQTNTNVTVHNGVFAAKLDFSTGFAGGKTFAGTFATAGTTPYLQIQVGTNTPLSPRQPFASTAYSFVASTVPDGSLTASKFAGGVLVPGGAAGGDLAGTYPNPLLATLFTSLGKVSGGLLTATPNGAAAADQQQAQAANAVSAGTTSATLWQSFTPAVTGNLTAVTFYVGSTNFNAQNVTLNVYLGEGTSGPSLSGLTIGIGAASGFQTFTVAPPAPLVAGQRYTLALTGSNFVWSGGTGNPYANGDAFAPSGVPAGFDFAFQTTMQPTNSLAANAPLSVNGGGNTAIFAQSTNSSNLSGAIVGVNTSASGNALLGITTGSGAGVKAIGYGNGAALSAYANGIGDALYASAYSNTNAIDAYANGSGNAVDAHTNGGGSALYADALGGGNALYAYSNAGYAGLFEGTVLVTGALTADNGVFNATLGGVGIGTASPTALLTISGADSTGSGSAAAAQISNTAAGGGAWTLRAGANGTNTPAGGFSIGNDAAYWLTIAGNGNVGIGHNMTNPAYALDVNGVIRANNVSVSSDARWKTNIHTLDNALEDVLNLRGVTYDWNREKWPAKQFPEGRQIGFIAQEVERVFPELVLTDSDGYKSVLYQNAVPILVEAIKAQEKRIKALEDANAELKKQNAAIAELAREIAEMKKEKRP